MAIPHLSKSKSRKGKREAYPKSVITTNYPDAKDMFIIIKKFQSFGACGGWEPRLDINFSKTSDLKIPLHYTPAYKWLVLLGLIKSSHQRPNLMRIKLECGYHQIIQLHVIEIVI